MKESFRFVSLRTLEAFKEDILDILRQFNMNYDDIELVEDGNNAKKDYLTSHGKNYIS